MWRILKPENRKIDQKKTKQVVIDTGYHKLLKEKASRAGMSIKTLLEGYLSELLTIGKENDL